MKYKKRFEFQYNNGMSAVGFYIDTLQCYFYRMDDFWNNHKQVFYCNKSYINERFKVYAHRVALFLFRGVFSSSRNR